MPAAAGAAIATAMVHPTLDVRSSAPVWCDRASRNSRKSLTSRSALVWDLHPSFHLRRTSRGVL